MTVSRRNFLLFGAAGLASVPAWAVESGPRFVMVGDSTMASYDHPPADRPDLTGWGQVFEEVFLPGVTVVNRAQSGASSKSFIGNGNWGKALAVGGDYVFIQFGHNDQPGKDERTTDPNGDYQRYLRQYIDEARAHGMRPVLVTSVGRRTFGGGRAVTTLTPYVDAMKAVAAEKSVPLLDLHAASMALYTRLGDAGSADLSASAEDRTHFSRKGARVIAGLVAELVAVSIPELRRYLRSAPRATLPAMVYAVPGVETALYAANAALFRNPGEYSFRVDCARGTTKGERWMWTPETSDVGDYPLHLWVSDPAGRVVDDAATMVRVVPANAGAGKEISLLLVGDSLTHGSIYPNELARLLSRPGNPTWRMLGTHMPTGVGPRVAHEGYGGWTWERFERRYEPNAPATGTGRNSPFVFPGVSGGAPVLDVARYLDEQCGGTRPDFVTFMLGINDCFGLNPEDPAAIDAGIDGMFRHAEAVLAAFRKAAPKAQLGLCLTTPPNARDGAFRANYGERYTRWGWRRIQHRLVQRQLAQWSGREKEGIFLVPTELNLDPMDGYPDNNAVHPNAAGYRQIGASIYAWLKSRLA